MMVEEPAFRPASSPVDERGLHPGRETTTGPKGLILSACNAALKGRSSTVGVEIPGTGLVMVETAGVAHAVVGPDFLCILDHARAGSPRLICVVNPTLQIAPRLWVVVISRVARSVG